MILRIVKNFKNNIISIKLPKYLNHLSTTIFDNANHITLSTNYGFKFQAAQGYLISQDHFDIGNLKAGYLSIDKNLLEKRISQKEQFLILEVNSPPNVSIIRKTSRHDFTTTLILKLAQK